MGSLSSAFCALEVGDRGLLRREAHSVSWGTLEMVAALRGHHSHILLNKSHLSSGGNSSLKYL